jgi:hypothetical protein
MNMDNKFMDDIVLEGMTVITQEGKSTFLSNKLIEQIPLLRDMKKILGSSNELTPLQPIKYETLHDIILIIDMPDTLLTAKNLGNIRLAEAANAANFLQMNDLVDTLCLCILDIFEKLDIKQLENHPII